MSSNYNRERKKSTKLMLAHLPSKPPPRLRLGGFTPPDDMPAGDYKLQCEGASKKPWKGGWRIELKFRVVEGDFIGVALHQWFPIDASGVISPRSRFAAHCTIALGRPLDADDDLNDPTSIFAGRFFKAFVGFRKTEKPKGGTPSMENAGRRKDGQDGLRVHDLLEREEL